MNPLIIAIPVIVLLAAVLVVAALRRRDAKAATGMLSGETIKRDSGEPSVLQREAATSSGREIERVAALDRRPGALEPAPAAAPAPYVPPDAETLGVTRRQFFNRSIVALFAFGLSAFGASVLAFLWPQPKGGFGSRITVGNVDDLLAEIAGVGGFLYNAEGRMWMTAYPVSAIERAEGVYTQAQLNAMEAGIQVLYQKCPHLGCRVPECATSQWFECPCHGSQYNQAGERKGGPAPRGMDGFATEVTGGVLTVDTGTVIQGPPLGVNTTGQEAEGPHCVTGSH